MLAPAWCASDGLGCHTGKVGVYIMKAALAPRPAVYKRDLSQDLAAGSVQVPAGGKGQVRYFSYFVSEMNRCGIQCEPVRRKQKGFGSIPLRLSFLFKNHSSGAV